MQAVIGKSGTFIINTGRNAALVVCCHVLEHIRSETVVNIFRHQGCIVEDDVRTGAIGDSFIDLGFETIQRLGFCDNFDIIMGCVEFSDDVFEGLFLTFGEGVPPGDSYLISSGCCTDHGKNHDGCQNKNKQILLHKVSPLVLEGSSAPLSINY